MDQDWTLKFSANQILLRFDVAPGLPPVRADSFRLEQVMYNLLDNARKYTPLGGTVTVTARLPGSNPTENKLQPVAGNANGDGCEDQVEIRVSDTGSGIPAADLPHIFERFYRADKARSRALGGTGLGLTIVKHLIQLHGGTVRAESAYGKGTSVIVRLPLEPINEARP